MPGEAGATWGNSMSRRIAQLLNEQLLRAIPSSGRCFGRWDTTSRNFIVYAEGGSADEPGYPRGEKLDNTWLVVDAASAGALLLGDTVPRPLANVLDTVLSI